MPRLRTKLDGVLVAAFAIGLIAPALDLLVRPHSVRSALRENRTPAGFPKPVTNLSTLMEFPHDLEAWFDDRLGLRDQLLRGHQALRHFVFHCEASPTLVEGKHHWLFFGADDSVPVQRGVSPLPANDLERWCTDIEARRDWLRSLGIEYAFVFAPNKQSVYPEHVPEEMRALGPTRLDQLEAYMHTHSDVRFLDLRPALIAEKTHDKGDDCVYYPLGSHWSWRGGWIAWNEIVRALSPVHPKVEAVPRETLVHVEVPQAASDSMAVNTYIDDLVHQRSFMDSVAKPAAEIRRTPIGEIVGSENHDTSLARIFVVHDSFGSWLLPFAAEGSSHMQAVWQHAFPKELIQTEHPDIVVQLYTERMLVWGMTPLAPQNDPLDATVFDALPKLWSSAEAWARADPPTEGGIAVTRLSTGFAVEQETESGILLLPACDVPYDSDLALHIDVESPVHAVSTFFYQLSHDPRFARNRFTTVILEPGRNDVRFRLRLPDVGGPIKLRIGSEKARYVLYSVEARSVR